MPAHGNEVSKRWCYGCRQEFAGESCPCGSVASALGRIPEWPPEGLAFLLGVIPWSDVEVEQRSYRAPAPRAYRRGHGPSR